jgi:flagellar basal-body rod modification protein FlgD
MSYLDTITNMQTQTNMVNFANGQKNLGSTKLDNHAFLQLMMTKLANQDPMNPMDDSQFLTQQATMTQVEKMDDLVSYLQGNSLLMQAGTMVGKKVDVQQLDGSTVTGTIDSISFANGSAKINMGPQSYPMSSVVKMYGSN